MSHVKASAPVVLAGRSTRKVGRFRFVNQSADAPASPAASPVLAPSAVPAAVACIRDVQGGEAEAVLLLF